MKLKTKIQLSFCVSMVIILSTIGVIITAMSERNSIKTVEDSMTTSATLTADHISQQMADYEKIVAMLGQAIAKTDLTDASASPETSSQERIYGYLKTYADEFGFTSVNVLNDKGISLVDGTDFSDRAYVQTALSGKPVISEINLSKLTNTYGVSIAAPVYSATGSIDGVIYFRLDIDFLMKILDATLISENCYSYIVDKNGYVITHPNKSLIYTYNLKDQKGAIADIINNSDKTGNVTYTYDGTKTISGYSEIKGSDGWRLIIAAPKTDFTKTINKMRNYIFVAVVLAIVIVLIISTLLSKNISDSVNKVKKALVEVSNGNFDIKLEKSYKHDEIAELQNTTVSLLDTLSGIIGQANVILGKIAQYDLTSPDMKNYPGSFDTLSTSINSIKSTLNDLIIEVQQAVYSVDTGSRELAQATAALSQGTVTQANSVQTLADDMNIIVDRIKRNSRREEEVNINLTNLDAQIKNANSQMKSLLSTVNDIEVMSSSILKIVDSIDSIAFQTNILSLNASVEAARAGEMGSGFAVVADEIRSLAEKCGDSSKKTSDLINECIKNIETAKANADTTFSSLSAVVDNSAKIATTFKEISNDTIEQADKSVLIQNEVNAISDVIQTNTATVEETAASTAVLSDQAEHLDEMIRNFKVLN